MKANRVSLVVIIVSLAFHIVTPKQHGIFKAFANLQFEDKRVLKATSSEILVSSLIHCVQLCARRNKCFGINFHQNKKGCEFFTEVHFEAVELLQPTADWKVYVLREAICDPNPCLNGGECKIKENDEYECICPNLIIGKRCEKDIRFKLDISSGDSFVTMPTTFGQLQNFTMCIAFELQSLGTLAYRTILNYFHVSSGTCSNIQFAVNNSTFWVRIFNTGYRIYYRPVSRIPTAACITWRQNTHQFQVYIRNTLAGSGTGDSRFILSSPGVLTLGTRYAKTVSDKCTPLVIQTSKFKGKISYFFLFNRFFTEEDVRRYSKVIIGEMSNVVISWDRFRDEKFWRNGVKFVPIIN